MFQPTTEQIQAELAKRMREYHAARRRAWTREIPWQALCGAVVVFSLTWLVGRSGQPIGDWLRVATLLWAVLMVPPVAVALPRKPTASDVELDLRVSAALAEYAAERSVVAPAVIA